LFLKCWLLLGYETGARQSDLWSLQAKHFHNGAVQWTQHKTGQPHVRALSQACQDVVDEMLRLSPDGTVLGWAMLPSGARRVMKRHLKLCGLSGSSKWLRRSGATHIEMAQPGKGRIHLGHKTVGLAERNYIDWAQVRPEWGLARNAAFIAAPRSLTAGLDLDGRCFLHSYDWRTDPEGAHLTTILTAPMVVAQWINGQYLFSTLDNVAYGAGSKVTMNITGKVGIMQGNGSDLMHGLALQSVFASDHAPYHEPQRLLMVVHAPRELLGRIVAQQEVLRKLFGNGWVQLACIDPESKPWLMARDFSWHSA
ncbi:MAG: DUF2309 family protein, partial [Proteobacteria bacterium]|nr:DUF2309 family protein [Pseudomonadota bacterium]